MEWQTFSDFKKYLIEWFCVSMPKDATDERWTSAECECRTYFKKYMCEHIIGIALRKKFATAPPEAKNIPLGVKRKRGRPCKAKTALVFQEENN